VAALEVDNLVTEFDTANGVLRAVDGVSFTLAPGQITGLVGESGSGKTVTGFSLLGLVDAPGRIVSGSIRLGGTELVGRPETELRRRRGAEIAMIFQDPIATLNPLLAIGAQMRMALEAHRSVSRREANARCIEVLDQVGIPEPRARLGSYPHELSGGMRQRVAIAIALLHGPAVIVADEPTTALDVSIQAQILHRMRMLADETGSVVLWISHDLATVSGLASRLLVMYAGRIVEFGNTAEVLRDPRHPYTRGLIDSLPGTVAAGEPLRQIPGGAPSLSALPPGCAFAPRCPHADVDCAKPVELHERGERGWRCIHPLGPERSDPFA